MSKKNMQKNLLSRVKKIKEALKWGGDKLKKVSIESACLDAELLLSAVLSASAPIFLNDMKPHWTTAFGSEAQARRADRPYIKRNNKWQIKRVNKKQIDNVWLYAHLEHIINKKQLTLYKKFIARRAKREPVAYILGHKEFYGLDFYVNKNVLIPRPESELLVEETLKQLTANSKQLTKKIIVIDVGTGCGCIPIAIAKNMYNVSCIKYYGLDIASGALMVARKNARFHQVANKINFMRSDLMNKILNTLYIIHNTKIIITANLPYLTPKQYRDNPELKFEPKNALLAGKEGLKYYKKLLNQLKLRITNYGLRITCLFEIDPSQKKAMQKMIKKLLSKSKIKFVRDLSGKWRVVKIEIKRNKKK